MGSPPARAVTSSPPPTHAAPSGRVYAALTLQVLISAGTYLAGKRAMAELPPITVVLWRFFLSALVFALLLAVTKGPKLPPRASLPRILFLGLLAGPLNQMFFFYGLSRSTAAHAALLYALTPMGVYLLSLARGRERVSARAAGGIATALAGVVVLLLGRGLAQAQGSLFGDLLILTAVAAWVVYTTEGKPFAAEVGPVRATSWSMIAAALLTLPAAPFAAHPLQVMEASGAARGCIAYLAVLTSVVAYLLWYYALSRTEASKVAIFSNLQPAATALAAWLLLGESLHWELWVGGLLIVAGVRLTQRARV
ncbi:DMT family transporter [Aggregicoccus sp. 17bor-14]|uniref:DMT family transporter n=1 Tax=Myxococcaceae TaxID=31 RepID=UPI00129C7F9C|nr:MULTISPECIES: DMT family transporter [Myxococcaceae]MBF5044567.1 DMT family transporter [Simulacricoccus sp. 17bor-14]MRI90312.1 DMT family transporter [Aggregicoccus sp. 17bor-14]